MILLEKGQNQKTYFMNKEVLVVFIISVLLVVSSCSSSPDENSLANYSKDEWAALVDSTISENYRAMKVKDLGNQLIEMTNTMKKEIEKSRSEAVALSENYHTTEEEMQELLNEFTEIRNRNFSQYRDVIFAMRSVVNEEEWKKLTN